MSWVLNSSPAWLSKLAGNTGWMTAAQFAITLDVAFRSIVIARLLSIPEFGVYAVAMAFVGLIVEMTNLNFGAVALTYGVKYDTHKKTALLKALIKFAYIIFFLFMGLACIVIAGSLALSYNSLFKVPDLFGPIMIVGAAAAFNMIDSLNKSILRLFDKFKISCFIDIFAALANMPLVLIILLLLPKTTEHALYATALCILVLSCASTLTTIIILSRILPGWTRETLSTLKPELGGMMKLAIGNSVSSSLIKLTRKADVLLLGALSQSSVVAIYDIGKKMAALIMIVRTPIALAAFPQISRSIAEKKMDRLKGLILKLFKIAIPLSLVGLTILWFVAPFLISLMYGEKYIASAPIFVGLSITSILYTLFFWAQAIILNLNKVIYLVVANLAAFFALIICAYIFVPNYQAMGMVYSAVIATVVSFAILSWVIIGIMRQDNDDR